MFFGEIMIKSAHLQAIRNLGSEEWSSVITKILFFGFKKDGLQKVYKNKI
jgi:hypothetical protein